MKKEIDWGKINSRITSGEKVSDIAEELGVAAGNIYYRIRKFGSAPAKPAAKKVVPTAAPSANGIGHYAAAIADLKAKREAINIAIELLEQLG